MVTKMKIQNRKMNGSLRNSVHSHLNRIECSQVSTCVIEGCAIRPKPTQTRKIAQKLYLKALTGHLFLCVARRVRRSRSAYTTVTATSSRPNSSTCGARCFQILTQPGSGLTTLGRPPSRYCAGSQYSVSNTAKVLAPVARSVLLPRKISFHG